MVENIWLWYMGGCQNYGPLLGVHIKGDMDIDADIDLQIHSSGRLSKLWSSCRSMKY